MTQPNRRAAMKIAASAAALAALPATAHAETERKRPVGWTNTTPNPLIVGGNGQVGSIQLLGADGVTEIGSLDGVNGLQFGYPQGLPNGPTLVYGVAGISWPRTTDIPAGQTGQSISVLEAPDTNSENRLYLGLDSGEYAGAAGAHSGSLWIASAPADLTETPVIALGPNTTLVASTPGATAGSPLPETWHTLAPAANWTGTISYRLMPDGDVRMKGQAQNTSGTVNGVLLATLPTGYRPLATCELIVSRPTQYTPGKIVIGTDGTLTYFPSSATDTVGFADLMAIRFTTL